MKFLLLGLLLALPAKADIVFFDLNFSPVEITAVTAAAKARGEAVHVFPERTADQQRQLDRQYRLMHSIQAKLRSCSGPAKCQELNRQYNAAYERLQAAVAKLRRVQDAELELIFSRLDGAGVSVSTMIFSGHSGGTGQVGGLLGGIVVDQVKRAFDRFPRLLEPVKAMLLWGCYSGTLHSLNGIWQKNFPSVSTWGGFENRSPLGIRESSGRFLKSFLLSEEKLRAAKSLKEAHRVFRSLDLVAELDGTAVVRDMYFTYDEAALVSDMLKRCQGFDAKMMDALECFENGKPGCESPPADHRGVLRDIYNYLQKNRHCRGGLQEKFPGLPSLEYLIRLIYLDNVKKNFVAHHGGEAASFGRLISEVAPAPSLVEFGKSTRAQDVAAFHRIQEGVNTKGFRDLSIVDRADWRPIVLAAMAKEGLTNLLGPSFYRSFDQSCVPFSWVDPGSLEKDSCQLSEALAEPLPVNMEAQITAMLAHSFFDRFLSDHVIDTLWIDLPADREIWKEGMMERARLTIKYLAELSDRSPLEEARLSTARAKLSRISAMNPPEIAVEEASALRGFVIFLDEKIEWAKEQVHGEAAKTVLENRRQVIQRRIIELEKITRAW